METTTTTTQLKGDIKKGLEALRTLRDEVKVQIHLAGMEAKEHWGKLEPRLEAVERAAQEATESSREALNETLKLVREFLGTLKK
jgi:hypothetical protein